MSGTTYLSLAAEFAKCQQAGLIDPTVVVLPQQRGDKLRKDPAARHGERRRSSCWNPETCWDSHTGSGRRGRPRPGSWLKIGSGMGIVQHYEGCWADHAFPVLLLNTGTRISASTTHGNRPSGWRYATKDEIAAASGRGRGSRS